MSVVTKLKNQYKLLDKQDIDNQKKESKEEAYKNKLKKLNKRLIRK